MTRLTTLFAICLLASALSSCKTPTSPGHIVSEKIVPFNGKYFLQQRIVRATDPYETELRTVQFAKL